MAKNHISDIRRWALLGAEQRLRQIADEAKAIHAAFPELRGRGRSVGASVRDVEQQSPQPKRRRRRMSKEARRRISEAQKERWAKRRRELKGVTGENIGQNARGPKARRKK